MIRLLVGLGNPGPEYEATRHNAGFWFIDEVARKLGTHAAARAQLLRAGRAREPAGGPAVAAEPMTFMNLSGKSVAALARFFKIAPDEILVAHDELDLLPGQVKLKLGGSHAGHNGLKDIQAQLGSADFWRLRLGIGHPGVKAEVIDYVLRKPPAEQREAIEKSIEQSVAALDLLLAGEMERAMMKIHAKPPRPEARPEGRAGVAADALATVRRPRQPGDAMKAVMAWHAGRASRQLPRQSRSTAAAISYGDEPCARRPGWSTSAIRAAPSSAPMPARWSPASGGSPPSCERDRRLRERVGKAGARGQPQRHAGAARHRERRAETEAEEAASRRPPARPSATSSRWPGQRQGQEGALSLERERLSLGARDRPIGASRHRGASVPCRRRYLAHSESFDLDVRRVDRDAADRAHLHALRLVEVADALGAAWPGRSRRSPGPSRSPGSGTRARRHRS